MAGFNQSTNYGAYTLTTNVFDPSNVYNSDIEPNLKLLLVRLYQDLNYMANVLNVKDTGQYTNAFEMVNNQQWFPDPALNSLSSTTPTQRPVFRTVINFGALPNFATKSVPHNILVNKGYSFTRIYGTATDPVGFTYLPIPHEAPSIQIDVDATNVNITTLANLTNYTITYVILEYIKS